MSGEWIAVLAVLTFVISNVLFRRTEGEASPIFINFIRTLIGTITFFILAFSFNVFSQIFLLPITLWIILFISFIFGQVIGDTAYFQAQKEIGTTNALAVSMVFPVITYILSIIFLNDPFDIRVVISLLLVSVGIYIIGKSKNNDENGIVAQKDLSTNLRLKAIMYAVVAAFGWAIGLIIIDYATNEINNILFTEGLSSVIGNVIRFPFALLILLSMVFYERYTKRSSNITKRTGKTWAILIIGALIGTSLGAYFYTEAARVAGATVMALVASASPLFSLPLTYFINGEKLTRFGFVGVILTILGVILIVF
jgi:drug/metabolite transporter (DMT)-like permease